MRVIHREVGNVSLDLTQQELSEMVNVMVNQARDLREEATKLRNSLDTYQFKVDNHLIEPLHGVGMIKLCQESLQRIGDKQKVVQEFLDIMKK